MSRFTSLNLDFLGFFASTLCAIHCLALPFLLTFGVMGGLEWLAHGLLEFVFILLAIVFAGWSLSKSQPKHGSWKAIRIALIGFAFLIISRFPEGELEHYLTAAGGIFIAYAHFVNWRLLHPTKVSHGTINELVPEQSTIRA